VRDWRGVGGGGMVTHAMLLITSRTKN